MLRSLHSHNFFNAFLIPNSRTIKHDMKNKQMGNNMIVTKQEMKKISKNKCNTKKIIIFATQK